MFMFHTPSIICIATFSIYTRILLWHIQHGPWLLVSTILPPPTNYIHFYQRHLRHNIANKKMLTSSIILLYFTTHKLIVMKLIILFNQFSICPTQWYWGAQNPWNHEYKKKISFQFCIPSNKWPLVIICLLCHPDQNVFHKMCIY